MMINKKGQTSTIMVTIAIVLGIALIVFLIWGFSTNWAMFSSTASLYTGSELAAAKEACRYQCETDLRSQFCDNDKTDAKLVCTSPELMGTGCDDRITCPTAT